MLTYINTNTYTRMKNTQKYTKKTPEIFKDPNMTIERNNVFLSYGYSMLLILLCVYIIKKLIW